MRLQLHTITASILLSVVSAAAFTVIDQLPICWQNCIEKPIPQCDSTDLNCLCHFAANPTLLPNLLTCVRKTCGTKYYPEFLTTPLQAVQAACGGTPYKIPDAAVGKADGAAESAYSAAVSAEAEGGGSIPRTRAKQSRDAEATTQGLRASVSSGASTTAVGASSTTTTSTPASSSAASVGPATGAATVSGPFTVSSASLAPSASTSTSTSTARTSGGSGGTPLDVGEQGAASVKKRAGSLLGLAIAFIVGVCF